MEEFFSTYEFGALRRLAMHSKAVSVALSLALPSIALAPIRKVQYIFLPFPLALLDYTLNPSETTLWRVK